MLLFHTILVATIQGITEFLPVSSSGHLVLIPLLTGFDDQGLVIDVFAHLGTLIAVILYFFKEVRITILGGFDILQGKFKTPGATLAICLIFSTIPVVIIGFVVYSMGVNDSLRNLKVIGFSTLLFGLFLFFCDKVGASQKNVKDWTLKDALILGGFQVISLIPGTSRSGIVISGSRLLGFERKDAARISMLMSIPTILAAGTLSVLDLIQNPQPTLLFLGVLVSIIAFIVALAALATMMRLLESISFTPYVIYRVFLGVILLWIAFI